MRIGDIMGIYDKLNLGEYLSSCDYPGRGIVVGKSECGKYGVCAYFIMGRSANSKNRVFVKLDSGDIEIRPFDESKVEDPSLIIYYPVRKTGNSLIVTNGDQTDTVYNFVKDGKTFEEALETRCFEPDAPNFTPRISAIMNFVGGDFTYKMSILKSIDEVGSDCARFTYSYPSVKGLGHIIHTYNHDGNPIPTFTGEPKRVNLSGDIDSLKDEIYENLSEDKKISIYVRYTNLETGEYEERIINKNV